MRAPALPRRSLECWRAGSRGGMPLDSPASSVPLAVTWSAPAGWGWEGRRAEVDPESRWEAVTGVQRLTTIRPGWILNTFGSRADKLGCGVEPQPPAFLVPGNNLVEDSFSLWWDGGQGGWFRPSCEPWGGQMKLCRPPQPPAVRPQPWGGAPPARRAESRRTALSTCRSGYVPYQGKGGREGTLALSGCIWIKTWTWGAWESWQRSWKRSGIRVSGVQGLVVWARKSCNSPPDAGLAGGWVCGLARLQGLSRLLGEEDIGERSPGGVGSFSLFRKRWGYL